MKTLKKIFSLLILVILAGSFFVSCDKIEKPYIEDDSGVWNGRKVLILDFTGHHCPNCPVGHRTLEELQQSFPDVIIPIAIHGTWFARFDNDITQDFHYDFTTPTGLELSGDLTGNPGYFNIIGLPTGTVNSLGPDQTLSPGTWSSEIAKYLQKFPEISIEIINSFSINDSIINSDITITSDISSSRNLSLCVYVVESYIIQMQEDDSAETSPVENYEHNHVLRASMNGTFGETINTENASILIGADFLKSYNIHLGNDWIPENCSIIAFVYDTETMEVLQAEESHLIQ